MSLTNNEEFKAAVEAMVARKMERPLLILSNFLAEYKHSLSGLDMADSEKPYPICSLDKLDDDFNLCKAEFVPGFSETFRKSITQGPDAAWRLETFKELAVMKESGRTENPFKRTPYSFKLVKLPYAAGEGEPTGIKEYVDSDELLITIRVYRPVRASHKVHTLETPMFAEEFQCLGSNLLTELRDKIGCVSNKQRFFDISENPFSAPVAKETDPGFFFITDTFYNDKRNPENADYSESVRKWAKTANGITANFKTAKMEETSFMDLTVSLGFPQVYQHHGMCEHIFVFSQVEVIRHKAAFQREHFPVRRSFSYYNMKPCHVCGTGPGCYVVINSNRLPEDPAYMCSKCFLSYHYVDGKKVGEFQAYRMTFLGENPEVESGLDEIDSSVEELGSEPTMSSGESTPPAFPNAELNAENKVGSSKCE